MRHLRPAVLTLAVLLQTASPALTDAWAGNPESAMDRCGASRRRRPASSRLIKEVKPKYTVEAMNEKVQGAVWVECNESAIDAAKQWMLEPGTKDGRPVPVLVTIELKFTLRDYPPEKAPLGLPEPFATTGQQDSAAELGWENLQIESPPSLIVGVVRPSGWRRVLLDTPGVLFSLKTTTPSLGASMLTPRSATISQLEPASAAELQKIGCRNSRHL